MLDREKEVKSEYSWILDKVTTHEINFNIVSHILYLPDFIIVSPEHG